MWRCCSWLFLKLCFIHFGNRPSGAHSTQSQKNKRKNKNNKSFTLMKSKSRIGVQHHFDNKSCIEYTNMVLWLFPYRANLNLNPNCTSFVDQFRDFTIIYCTQLWCFSFPLTNETPDMVEWKAFLPFVIGCYSKIHRQV